MKQTALIKISRELLSFALCLSVSSGATMRIFGQNQIESARRINRAKPADAAQAFEKIVKFGRSDDFVKVLMRGLTPTEAISALAWLDAKDRSFFKAVFDAHNRKADEFSKRRFENTLPGT